METRGVVIAVGTAAVIIAVLVINLSTRGINPMNLPCYRQSECLVARDRMADGVVVWSDIVGRIIQLQVKQHAVNITVAFKRSHYLLKCVGCNPVVAVKHCDNLAVGMEQFVIAGFSLTLVLCVAHHGYAVVGRSIAVYYVKRAVGRAVVDTYKLPIAMRLRQHRLYALRQIGGCVINCCQNRYLHRVFA